ncbi:MAG: iron-hydroxamate transporter substrate-binding subunit [Methanoregula sp. PtaU1.Bin051]|nr:MAG: iron-hydroxamate transporter substrate-binding subunit [Methanoregula sp. PtaU1.Bin051]
MKAINFFVVFFGIIWVACFFIICTASAAVQEEIPRNNNEIHTYAGQILKEEILSYLAGEYLNEKKSCLSADQIASAIKYYPEYPRRITDTAGTTITIYRPLSRIIAFNYFPLGVLAAENQTIGIADAAMREARIIPWLTTKVNVGGGGGVEPDMETILACKPDLLLTYTQVGPGRDFFENRLPDNVPVIRQDYSRPHAMVSELNKLGYLINRTDRSQAYADWYNSRMTKIQQRIDMLPDNEKVRVFIDSWVGKGSDPNVRTTVSSGMASSHYNLYLTENGAVNIAENLTNPQGAVDIEWLAQQNPDIILGVARKGGYGTEDIRELRDQYDELMNHPALQEISAIKNKRVYIICWLYTNSLAYPAARAQIAK